MATLWFSLQLFWIFALAGETPTQKLDPTPVHEAYMEYCRGNSEKGYQILDDVLRGGPRADIYFLRWFFLPEPYRWIYQTHEPSLQSGQIPKEELDRIIMAALLINRRSEDIEFLESLLDFHSDEPALESQRFTQLALLMAVKRQPMEIQLDHIEAALQALGYVDSALLDWLISVPFEEPELQKRTEKYIPLIEKLPPNDPNRHLLRAAVELRKEKPDENALFELYKKAHEECPVDFTFIQRLGIQALLVEKVDLGLKLLNQLTQDFLHYPAEINFHLAWFYAPDEPELARHHLILAKRAQPYLSAEQFHQLELLEPEIERKLNQTPVSAYVIGAFAILFLLGIVGWQVKLRR